MNVTELAEHIATEHDMDKKQARALVEGVFKAVVEAAQKGDEVSIPGFGKFKVASREARQGRNPATGENHSDRRLQEAQLHAGQAGQGRHEPAAARARPAKPAAKRAPRSSPTRAGGRTAGSRRFAPARSVRFETPMPGCRSTPSRAGPPTGRPPSSSSSIPRRSSIGTARSIAPAPPSPISGANISRRTCSPPPASSRPTRSTTPSRPPPPPSLSSSLATHRPGGDRGRICHPWVNPPHEEEVTAHNSFASNLPPDLMRRKLTVLRDAIATNYGAAPLVYKAGRYGIGPDTPAILSALGFTADTSVVPHLDSVDKGGPDFRALPDRPFMTGSAIAELPLSVHFNGHLARFGRGTFPLLSRFEHLRAPGIASRLGLLERLRLSPEDHSAADMKRQTQAAIAAGHRYFMLTYHSSSLMPGGSPYARTRADRDAFVATLTKYIEFFTSMPGWATLTASRLAERMRTETSL